MSKQKKIREKFWYKMKLFPMVPDPTDEDAFPKLLWWKNSWTYVMWDEDLKKWATDDDQFPLESDEFPTEWAPVPPPPARVMYDFIVEMLKEKEGELNAK